MSPLDAPGGGAFAMGVNYWPARTAMRWWTISANARAGHPAVSAWDLGNENSNCVRPPDQGAGLIEPGEFYTADGSHLARLYQRYCAERPTAGSSG